jgi:hypothetical protein
LQLRNRPEGLKRKSGAIFEKIKIAPKTLVTDFGCIAASACRFRGVDANR